MIHAKIVSMKKRNQYYECSVTHISKSIKLMGEKLPKITVESHQQIHVLRFRIFPNREERNEFNKLIVDNWKPIKGIRWAYYWNSSAIIVCIKSHSKTKKIIGKISYVHYSIADSCIDLMNMVLNYHRRHLEMKKDWIASISEWLCEIIR